MTKRIYIMGFILFFLPVFTLYAQEKPSEKKSDEEIINEYKRWSSIKDDWPNLGRYREANSKLSVPGPEESRVVFMGNSITDGWIKASPEFFEGRPYIDRGISGQTTPQMLVRFRQDVIDLKPQVVVILAGTNDIAGNTGPSTLKMIMNNIASMADLAKANGIEVILSSILPAYDYPWKPGLEPAPKIVTLNKRIKEYTNENDMIYLDYFTSMADERMGLKSEYTYDGVHPDKEGYRVMEGLVEEAIKMALNK